MRLKYCKPETEVDYLVLEEFVLYDLNNNPRIIEDMGEPDDLLYW